MSHLRWVVADEVLVISTFLVELRCMVPQHKQSGVSPPRLRFPNAVRRPLPCIPDSLPSGVAVPTSGWVVGSREWNN
ncbi:hypothetical protein HW132_26415 [Brasilonema sp. CT11]|nr:hypothetical protein [Brasilonema sp. CT11]